ncbi:S9 family peptidase [Thermopolyspora sp. NPDC052614]|uniref:S9 family peptidase n=1 Tax=Thermopolyspora sp. NPDC052614 TaxID=3155682 RepID=UPI00342BE7C4
MPPASPRLTCDDLFRLAVPSDPCLRPDGGAVAYTLVTADRDADDHRSEIWLAAPGEQPRALTHGPNDSCPRWSPDGRTLAFLRPVDGKAQIHLLPMDGGEPKAITAAALGAGTPVWSPDGSRIAYAGPYAEKEIDPHAPVVADRLEYKADGAGLLRGVTMHLFVTDLATGETTRVTRGDFHAGEPSWSPDGRRLAFAASMDDDRDLVLSAAAYAVEASGGEPERLTGPELICAGVWWLGERLIVAALDAKRPMGHVRLYELGPDARGLCALDRNVMTGAPGYPGAPPRLHQGEIVFCARDGGFTHLYRLDGTKLVGGDQVVSGASAAAGRIAYVAATPYSAGNLYLIDDGGEVETLAAYEPQGVELYTPQTRTFTIDDGTTVEGFVLRDESRTGPGPLLLDVHGGPHNAWAPVFDGVHLYHQVLAARGWTVLTVNPRGSDGYGEAFYTAALGAWGIADAGDLLGPIDTLIAEGVADPDRLAVTGYSYGGYMSCWLTTRTDRFKAAILGGCLSDLTSSAGTSDLGHIIDEHEIVERPAEQSPITYVDRVRTPTLLLHGEADDRCPVGQAEQWFAALRERRVPVRMVRYPGASHLFIINGRPSHRADYNERIIAWLEHWIPAAGGPASPS